MLIVGGVLIFEQEVRQAEVVGLFLSMISLNHNLSSHESCIQVRVYI